MILHNIFAGYGTLFTAVITLALGVFVWSQNRRSPLNITFALMSLSIAGWSTSILFQLTVFLNDIGKALLFAKLANCFGILTAMLWLHFILVLLDKAKRMGKILALCYSLTFTIAFLTLSTNWFVSGLQTICNIEKYGRAGRFYPLYLLFFSLLIIYGARNIFNEYRQSSGVKRYQIRYILLGSLIGFSLGTTTAIPQLGISIYPLGLYLSWLYIPLIAYAIVRYRLMDILVAINKSVLFIVTVTLVFVVYGIVSRLFEPVLGTWPAMALSMIAIVFVLLSTPLRSKLTKLVDHYVYRGKYDYHEVIREAAQKLVSILDLDALFNYLLSTIQNTMEVEKVCLLLREEAKSDNEQETSFSCYHIRASRGLDKAIAATFSLHNGIVGYLYNKKGSLVKEELEQMLPQEQVHRLYRQINILSPALIVPLFYAERLLGMLTLDNKTKKEPYSSADINLLQFLANQAATVLENVRLREEAITDGLTRLYHYRYFRVRLEEEIQRAKRYKHPLSLVMIDIDFFKHFNDTHGHLKGDMALQGLAYLLRKDCRDIDVISRYGGEEFTVILPQASIDEARQLAERIKKNVAKASLGPSRLTVSAGVTNFYPDDDRDDMIKKVDTAMYEAKKNGRNRVEVL